MNEICCGSGDASAMSNLEASRLELGGDLSELRRLAEWIKARTPQVLSADTVFAVQLCLEEAVANIIMHGGAKDDRLKIAIELERDGGTLVARIEDTGCEFDPTQFPPVSVAKSLEKGESRRLWPPPDTLLCQWHALRAARGLQSADATVCRTALNTGSASGGAIWLSRAEGASPQFRTIAPISVITTT